MTIAWRRATSELFLQGGGMLICCPAVRHHPSSARMLRMLALRTAGLMRRGARRFACEVDALYRWLS